MDKVKEMLSVPFLPNLGDFGISLSQKRTFEAPAKEAFSAQTA